VDQDLLREVLQSPLDDLDRRSAFRLRADHLRGFATAVLIAAAVLAFARWVGGGVSEGLRDVVHPVGSVRVRVPPLDLHGLTADPATGRLIMMGGRSLAGAAHSDDLSNQTWQYTDRSWWWLRDGGPGARQGHALAFDTESGVAVLFGGSVTRYEPCFVVEWCGLDAVADTWTFEPVEGIWILQPTTGGPSPRFGHAAAYDHATDRIVVFGGAALVEGRHAALADTWTYDVDTATWDRIETDTAPLPRAHHVMVAQPDGGVLLLGGTGPSLETTDLWSFDGSAWTLVDGDLGIGTRSMTAAAFDGDTLVVFGGTGRDAGGGASRFLDDVLAIDPATGAVSTLTRFPEKLWRHAAVADPLGDGIIVVVREQTLRYRPGTNEWEDLTATLVVGP
jgi:hypothetical protein